MAPSVPLKDKNKLIIFENKKIRHTWYKDDWWFSVVDVVGILVSNVNYRRYWSDLKIKLKEEGSQLYDIIVQLKLKSSDGKKYLTDCANKQSLFRIIQSIPSKKVEPFKLWLAKVGSERIDEIENPELAQERMKLLYEQKGYPKSWIEKRIRGIVIRQDLTDEWKNRGIEENKDFAILTNEIAKATFGVSVGEHRKIKGMQNKNANLRDCMTDWELILAMIGEKATTDITIVKDNQDFKECETSAREGGEIAGNTRREIEQKTGRVIITKNNFIGKQKKKIKKVEMANGK